MRQRKHIGLVTLITCLKSEQGLKIKFEGSEGGQGVAQLELKIIQHGLHLPNELLKFVGGTLEEITA